MAFFESQKEAISWPENGNKLQSWICKNLYVENIDKKWKKMKNLLVYWNINQRAGNDETKLLIFIKINPRGLVKLINVIMLQIKINFYLTIINFCIFFNINILTVNIFFKKIIHVLYKIDKKMIIKSKKGIRAFFFRWIIYVN